MGRIKDTLLCGIKKIIYSDGMTPLPWNVTIPVFFLLLLNTMSMTMAFAFLPKLVKSFGFSEVDTGYQVGIIGSCFFIGRIPFSIIWGYCADKYGRKKLTIIASISLMISTLAFGFSTNVKWAIITRTLQGAAMGIVIIGKALVTSISDDTNSSLAMSVVLGGYSVGAICGPVVGGFMAFPHDLYPSIFSDETIFTKFRVLLPNGILALGLLLGTIASMIYIPKDKIKTQEQPVNKKNGIHNKVVKYKRENEKTFLLDNQIKKNNIAINYNIMIIKEDSGNWIETKRKSKYSFKKSALGRMILNRGCVMTVLLYGIYAYTGVGYVEQFPLYAATAREYHGYGFTPSEIGISLMITSVIILVAQFTIMTRVVKYFGLIKCFKYSCLMIGLLIPLTPLWERIENRYLFWFVMMFSYVCTKFFNALAFLCINVMINNSVEPELSGFVNGLGMTVSTIGRAIAVSSIGSMFGWSLTNVKDVASNTDPLGFPFNQYFTFLFISLVSFATAIYAMFLPKTLDKKIVVRN